ncbi:MAG: murein biosynthesis integral membrane protein MurJ [Actinomycetota bacterium]|nr:murein biosynthesis integral membrane protein MurJ [Actinomycetota bacterium]
MAEQQAAGTPAAAPTATAPARSALVMAAGTVLSRVSGFARLLAVAWVLGQGRLADAFNQANTVPNQVYDLLLGGVLSATLLPVLMQSLSRSGSRDDDDAVPAIVSFLTVALVAATVLFWLAAPLIVRLFLLDARGPEVGAERALATNWLRLFAPQLLFMGLITVTTALLNARRRFASVAFSPVLANLVAIGALVVADQMVRPSSISGYRQDAAAVAVVGIGTTVGYLAQLIAQLPALFRAKVPLRPRWAPGHPALRAIGRLSGWTLGAVAANQLSYALVAVLAQNKRGDFSAFSYAYAFMLLPYAVVAVSIAYAVAPDLAERWSLGNTAAFGAQLARAARVTIVLLLPGGVGYALVARPTVVVALAHGHLSVASAELTGTLLAIFALGLPGFSAYLLIMRAFQAKQDTRSMFWLYVLENALTVVGAVCLYPVVGVKGLALAWIGSYTVTLPLAWLRLRQSIALAFPLAWFSKTAVSTAVMAGSVALVLALVPPTGSFALGVGRLVLAVAVGVGVFVVTARWFGIEELRRLPERWRALTAPAGAARLPGGANEA